MSDNRYFNVPWIWFKVKFFFHIGTIGSDLFLKYIGKMPEEYVNGTA